MNRILILLLFLSNSVLAQVNLNQGLVAYYPFSGNANDASGNNNNPVFNNATLAADRFGNPNSAYLFNGVDNYMKILNNPTINSTNKLSICAWVKVNGFYTGTCHGNEIVMKGDADYLTGNYLLRFDDSYYTNGQNCSIPQPDINHETFFGVQSGQLPGSPFIQTNQWYCVIFVCDGTTAKTYVNCQLTGSGPANGITFTNNYDLCLGKMNNALYPYWFNGVMDDVRIYNRDLTIDEVNVLSGCLTPTPCNSWLGLPNQPSYINVGDLDVTGNQITVEAVINRTTPYSGGPLYAGDIVSKHDNPSDANYLLRPNSAEITTTNGYFRTPDICEIQLNKTYHVAMVYNGSTLKFYRNGFLMSQIPATGNLFQNNWQTRIGLYQNALFNTNFIGYINEVRIWNVARTQSQIQTYMNSSLPNPTTQTGLLAYYTFDDLLNKQGNTAWNGTLGGSASINQTNPNCTFIADSCYVPTPISNIINTYTPVLALDVCKNKVTVEDASTFNTGDTVLMIQMKGAVIDSSNSASFGTITDYKNSGNYEFNYVKSKSGNIIELKNALTRQYDIPIGKVQLVRVPYYQDANVTSTLTCLPWDGSKGGVLVLNVQDTVTLNANIDISGKGFKGGQATNIMNNSTFCHENNYYYPNDPTKAAPKGESIAIISQLKAYGRGALANAGGGGVGHNSGGGGGSNIAQGGKGGKEWITCNPIDNGGISGYALNYSNATNKIFLGGGGGAGQCDNLPGFNSNGGNGGGIIIIRASFFKANSYSIKSNGGGGLECIRDPSQQYKCHEGMGGGGSGGTILINANTYLDNLQIEVKGGKGADMNGEAIGQLGPGGGGSGGVTWFNSGAIPANVTVITSGGINGVNIIYGNDSYGAMPGADGINMYNLNIPVDNVLFKPNIDSVRISDTATGCKSFDFKGFGYTNTNPVANWQWYFGDGGTANTQNTSHTYATGGNFTVKLVITDINGCKDSISTIVSTTILNFDFNYQFNTCNPLSVQFHGIGTDSQSPYWDFGDGGTNAGNLNPSHTYSSTGNYTVKYSVSNGTCSDTLTKIISLTIINADIISTNDTTICYGTSKQLRTVPALSFCWSPTTYLDNPGLPNPITSPPHNITYYYTAEITGNNLIVNGDFNAGNTGFTSQYVYANPNTTEGQYFVGINPQAWNPSMSPCPDHTTGTGKMMMVNGAPVPNVNVWKETVTVAPNTNYAFSTWIQALWPPNPAQLQFSINGNDIGSLITASLPTCTWTQFYTTWNSGNSTSAVISVINKNTQVQGNDFALDDISFAPIFIKRDSVKIFVDSPLVRTNNDITFCAGGSAQLNATGGISYSWSPPTGLNNPSIPNPIASPSATTQYIVTGTTVNGCSAKDTVLITVDPKPAITKSGDTTICRNASVQIFAGGGTSYSWTPIATLNDPTIPNPVATPTANTTYYVTVTNSNNCNNNDSVKVFIRPAAVFTISPNISTCLNTPAQLNASGGDIYSWTPSNYLNDPNIGNPQANPPGSTLYSVKIKDSNCNDSATLTTQVMVLPLPTIQTTKQNDIDCSNDASQLNASGALQYAWTPAGTLSNPTISNPVARPTITTLYSVQGTDVNGCKNTDTISVFVLGINKGKYLMPTAFTPNNDGINDCYGVKLWGIIQELDFSIYNRWGERIFHTTTPGQCWDGTYKGQLQNPDVYVYMVKAKTSCDNNVFRKGTFVLIR